MTIFTPIVKVSLSAHRLLVEQALANQGTTLEAFLADRSHKSMEEAWLDLRQATGIEFSVRTLYRWADTLEISA